MVSPVYYNLYAGIESRLARAETPVDNIDAMFSMVSEEMKGKRFDFALRGNSLVLGAYTQLDLARYLDTRNCYDHCTFVLAKNNCNAAIPLHACRSRSKLFSYIKTMLDAKVFPLVERCHIPLMAFAVALNNTRVQSDLFKTVEFITRRMTNFEASLWDSIEDLALMDARPFLAVRRIIRPIEAGFFRNLPDIMLDLDRLTPRRELSVDISAHNLLAPQAKYHFHRLILQPCKEYIDRMHTAMDATIFYGRLVDLHSKRFQLADNIDDDTKIAYFKLARIYLACSHIDEGDFSIKWRVEAGKLLAKAYG